jgi:hypothetical protein
MSDITEELSTADVLRRAKREIEERGWTRRKYVDEDGRLCVYGAINLAAGGDPTYPWPMTADRAVRKLQAITGYTFLDDWNDTQPSVEPVLAAFDRAIALAESEATA